MENRLGKNTTPWGSNSRTSVIDLARLTTSLCKSNHLFLSFFVLFLFCFIFKWIENRNGKSATKLTHSFRLFFFFFSCFAFFFVYFFIDCVYPFHLPEIPFPLLLYFFSSFAVVIVIAATTAVCCYIIFHSFTFTSFLFGFCVELMVISFRQNWISLNSKRNQQHNRRIRKETKRIKHVARMQFCTSSNNWSK